MVKREDFEQAINTMVETAKKQRLVAIQVNSGELHRLVGDYPSTDHRMPMCCDVMRKAMKHSDIIISEPPKGQGASLTIEYHIA